MSVTLPAGAMLSLTKTAAGVTAVTVEIGWILPSPDDYDVDAFAIALGTDGKAPTDSDFVYYSNRTSPDRAITLTSNEAGASDNDHVFTIDLTAVSEHITSIVFPVSIHDAQFRQHSFDQVRDVFIRVLSQDTGTELARYDLPNAVTPVSNTAALLGDLHRRGTDWIFRPLGQAVPEGFEGLARLYARREDNA
ncbi:TerD family protein [Prescottella subtropica]|uniref:TerD family protein n=1 Tax=Prescottella subtropica TaxID=2545757 RepID=UPI0010F8E318|nr:TerD family protein [Prescottella subtropica]